MLTSECVDLLLLYLHSTEAMVHETALSKGSAIVNCPGFQRLDSLYACLHATKCWFDVFLNLSPALYVGFSVPVFTQSARCIMTLFKLRTFDDPIWDRELVQNTASLSFILAQIIERYTQVKVMADLDHGASKDEDTFSRTARTLSAIKTWWDAKVAAELKDSMVLDETLGDINMDCLDDTWLRDIFGQGDCQFGASQDASMRWSSGGTGF